MPHNLIIFIDSLPFNYLPQTRYLSHFPVQQSVTPGFGFSINIKPEMFAGLSPDQLGYLGEWGYCAVAEDSTSTKLLALLQPARHWPVLDRLLHRAIARFCGCRIDNIPFGYLSYFTHEGRESVYSPCFPRPTLFTQHAIEMVSAESSGQPRGQRDLAACARAEAVIADTNGHLYLSLVDLDYVGHVYGVGSSEYDRFVSKLEEAVEKVITAYRNRHRQINVVVLSDHGMANVHQHVSVHPERIVGPSRRDTYVYFVDSVMLRAWTFDKEVAGRLRDFLHSLGYGHLLSADERQRFDLTGSARAGDIVFVLDEGYCFSPSFFGLRAPRAMHGYHPDVESQKAAFLYEGVTPLGEGHDYSTIGVYSVLRSLFV